MSSVLLILFVRVVFLNAVIGKNNVCGVFWTLLHERGSVCTNSLDRADLASESQGCLNSWSDFCIDSNVVEHDSRAICFLFKSHCCCVCVVWHEMKMVAVFGRERAVTREFGPSGEKGGVYMCP